MPVAFDTLKAARRLQDEAGFSEKQARVLVSTLAEGIGENLATKADIEAEFRAIHSEMQASDERTQAGFTAIRSEFQAIRSEMDAREQRMKLHLGAMVATATVIVLASIGIVTAIILTSG